MRSSEADLAKLKRLALLELSAEEEEEVERRIHEIIEYLDELRNLDLSGVKPMYTVEFEEPSYREDKPSSYNADKLLKIVPRKKDRYVKAPRIV